MPDWVLRAASAVTIAVIDTGADLSAPDLAAKNPVVVQPRATGRATCATRVGHGTFVAALAAGSVTNGEGIAGFGGDAKLMSSRPERATARFTDVDEAAAIAYAVDHGARIINLSFGGTTTTATERSAIDYAAAHGVLVVAAAGNDYASGNPALYPAALVQPLGSNGVGGIGLAVGASTRVGERAAVLEHRARTSRSPRRATMSSPPCRRRRRRRASRASRCPARSAASTATASGTSFAAPRGRRRGGARHGGESRSLARRTSRSPQAERVGRGRLDAGARLRRDRRRRGRRARDRRRRPSRSAPASSSQLASSSGSVTTDGDALVAAPRSSTAGRRSRSTRHAARQVEAGCRPCHDAAGERGSRSRRRRRR